VKNSGQFITKDEDELLDKYLKEHNDRGLAKLLAHLSMKYHIGKHGQPLDSEGQQHIESAIALVHSKLFK